MRDGSPNRIVSRTFFGEVAPRGAYVEGDLFGELAEYGLALYYHAFCPVSPRLDGARAHALGVVRHGELGGGAHHPPDSPAMAARAVGVVEGKTAHREVFESFAANFAGERAAQPQRFPFARGLRLRRVKHRRRVGALPERQFQRVRHPVARGRRRRESVHHELEGMGFGRRQGRENPLFGGGVVEFEYFPRDPCALPRLLAQGFKLLFQRGGFARNPRGEDVSARVGRQGEDGVDAFVKAAARYPAAVARAPLLSRHAPNQAGVVGYFREGRERAARVGAERLHLLYGYHRREPRYGAHRRPVDLAEGAPSLGGKALHILAVSLGVNGVESQRRLARAAAPRERHELPARNVDVHVFEVVLAGSPYLYESRVRGLCRALL